MAALLFRDTNPYQPAHRVVAVRDDGFVSLQFQLVYGAETGRKRPRAQTIDF